MDEWHDFFLAQAGAPGVLTGLVFVGVSINLQHGRSILACGGHGLLDPRGVVRGVGVAHRDQSVGEDRSVSPSHHRSA
jgi:hypothetical protein